MRLWTKPGHPGACPRCRRAGTVRWTWRPDMEPTRETARCYSPCGWVEHRDYVAEQSDARASKQTASVVTSPAAQSGEGQA